MAASTLKLRVEGMDCGSCAQKIETAMRRLPGVTEVEVSISSASMSITVDEDRTSRAAIRAKIDTLGFKAHDPAPVGTDPSHVAAAGKAPGRPPRRGGW